MSGATALATAFFLVLLTLAGGYLVFQTYAPPASATPTVPEVRQFAVALHTMPLGDGTMLHWMPGALVVNQGDSIILTVTNADPDNPHGFTLGGFAISTEAPIQPGKSTTFRFRASRAGIFQFGCNLAGCTRDHAAQTGQLIVLRVP